MAANCVDQAQIEMITRNAVAKMIFDHTLQAGLRDCLDCNWLGHETKVVTCANLAVLVNDMIENGEIDLPDFPDMPDMPARIIELSINIDGELVATRDDGSSISVLLRDFIENIFSELMAAIFPCGPMIEVIHDDTLVGDGTSCFPLGVNMAGLTFDTTATLPTTEEPELPTVMYGDRNFILGGPDGFMVVGGKKVPYWN